MLFFIGLLILSILSFTNTLYYSISLLFIVLFVLCDLVSRLILHPLTILILIIVYVGAIMILIGYICAVCPNMILVSYSSTNFSYLLYSLIFFLFKPMDLFVVNLDQFLPLSEYFYSSSGLCLFSLIVVILFVTLLIVTSQYTTPSGPFRSVSV